MNTLNSESTQRPLRTADLAAAGSRSDALEAKERDDRELLDANESDASGSTGRERLDPLFSAEMAEDFRARWTAVQSSFVDDPSDAVRQGDELVAQVMKSLAESFAAEREELEGEVSEGGQASTETLRVTLRRYRSFFERLLSL